MQYQIDGGVLPFVTIYLDPNESIITEAGAMSWMSPNMHMETKGRGGVGKMIGRAFSGESMFQNIYTAQGGPGMIALASNFPGTILAYQMQFGQDIIVQKRAFLACEVGVETEVHFQKKIGSAFFGGEGLIMQRFSGQGLVFMEIDGALQEFDLQPGHQLILDTGYLVAMSATCSMDVQSTGGLKNMAFGGEGIFNTVVTGPGKVFVQSMPLSNLRSLLCVQS